MKKLFLFGISLFLITLPSLAQTYTVTTGLPLIEIATPSTGVTTPTMGSNGYRDITIGFNFNFYGTSYSQLTLGDNGWITFGGGIANNNAGLLPVSSGPNLLAFAWTDQVPNQAGVLVNYFVSGTAPNRIFVLNYKNVPAFGNLSNLTSLQLQLYEGATGKIEIHNLTNNSAGTERTIGIQKANATVATDWLSPAGMNASTTIALSNSTIRFQACSSTFTLSVTGSPSNGQICFYSVSLNRSVSPSGTYTFRWIKDGVLINGATSTSYGATAAGSYQVQATNSGGCTLTSTPFAVTASFTPTITPTGPISLCSPTPTLTGSVTPSATYKYQWQSSGNTIAGATTTTYLPTTAYQSDTNRTYRLVVTNPTTNCTIYSNEVKAVQKFGARIDYFYNSSSTIEVTDTLRICAGGSYKLKATKYLGGTYTQQWFRNGTAINGATQDTLRITQAGSYYVAITQGNCTLNTATVEAKTATAANFTVAATRSPTSGQLCTTSNSGQVQLNYSFTPSQSTSGLRFEWIIESNVVSTSSFFNTRTPGSYALKVTTPGNCVATSPAVSVTGAFSVSTTPNTPFNLCEPIPTIVGSVTPAGTYTYGWESASVNSDSYGTLSGETLTNYSPNPNNINQSQKYRFTATDASNCKIVSMPVVVNFSFSAIIDRHFSVPAIYRYGGANADTAFICTGSNVKLRAYQNYGGFTSLSYQWFKDNVAISGATQDTLRIGMAGRYFAKITRNGCTLSTKEVIVNVLTSAPFTVNITPPNPTYCGSGNSLTATVIPSGSYTFQWFKEGAIEQNSTSSGYFAYDTLNYSVRVRASGCEATATRKVNPKFRVSVTPTGGALCGGVTSIPLTANVTPAGSYTYEWRNNGAIVGTNSSYAATTGGNYQLRVSETGNNNCYIYSSAVPISATGPTINIRQVGSNNYLNESSVQNFCAGQSVSFEIIAVVPTGAGVSYSWIGPNNYTSSQANLVLNNLTAIMAGTYVLTANIGGPCPTTLVRQVQIGVTVPQLNAGFSLGTNTSADCNIAGTRVLYLSSSVSNTQGSSVSYTWSGPSGYMNIAEDPIINPATAANDGCYTVTATFTGVCNTVITEKVGVVVTPATPAGPNNLIAYGGSVSCYGSTVNISVNRGGTGFTYSWTGPNGYTSSQASNTITVTAQTVGTYTVTVTPVGTPNPCLPGGTVTTVVSRPNSTPNPIFYVYDKRFAPGSTISVTPDYYSADDSVWVWQKLPSGPTYNGKTLTIPNTDESHEGRYRVTLLSKKNCQGNTGTYSRDIIILVDPYRTTQLSCDLLKNLPKDVYYCPEDNGLVSLSGYSVINPYDAIATYLWNGPNGFTTETRYPYLSNVSNAQAGVYTVTATGYGACAGKTMTGSVTLHTSPKAVITGNPTFCAGNTIFLYGNMYPSKNNNEAGGTETYSWTGPNGFTSNSQSISISNANVSHAGTYNLTITRTGGCCGGVVTTSYDISLSNSAYFNPDDLIAYSSPMIGSSERNINALYPQNGSFYIECNFSGGVTTSWTGPDGFTSNTNRNEFFSATAAKAGTYTLTFSRTQSGCSQPATVSKSITVNFQNCTGGEAITLSSPLDDISLGTVQKSGSIITATNQITGAANVTYRSTSHVLLNPGFKVDAGAVFSTSFGNAATCPVD